MSPKPTTRIAARTSAVGFSSGYRWRGRSSDWGQLLWASRGAISVTIAQSQWMVPGRQALWLPPGTAHDVTMVGSGVLRSLFLTRRWCRELGEGPRTVAFAPLLRELIRRAIEREVLDMTRAHDARVMRLLLDELRDALARNTVPVDLPMPSDPRALRAAQQLLQAPDDTPTVQQVAQQSGASVRTLERLFVSSTGLSLGLWRQRAALIHAMGRLADGASVTHAALAAGYSSTSAFVAAFKRLTGTTPGRFATTASGSAARLR